MKPLLPVGAFLMGAFLTVALSAMAQTKPAALAAPHWTTAIVDEDFIYHDTTIGFAGEPMNMIGLTTYQTELLVRHDNEAYARAEQKKRSLMVDILKKVEEQKNDLLEKGYEPFSATVYASPSAGQEEVWFFRKRTN